MDEQINYQVQAVHQDVEGLKDQLVLKDMPAYPPGFTPQRSSSPHMVDRSIDAAQLCLISDVVIPHKFKTPNFEKYNGTMCPKTPDRLDLQRMEKKNVETFKDYAQRWRELATQVQPPMTDKELTAMFINTLWASYYDRMVRGASTNFSDVITIRERIEFGMKNERITDFDSKTRRMMTPKKKEEEIHELSSTQRVAADKTREELDVNQNPLPNHEGPAINVVDTFTERYKNKVYDVATSMNTLFQIFRGAGYLSQRFNNDDGEKFGCANMKQCLFHPEIDDHSIEDCCELTNKCPPEFELNNWEIKKTLKVSKGSRKIHNRGAKVEGDINGIIDFEVLICNLEHNIEEDESDISSELLRLIEQEEKKTAISRDFEGYQFGSTRRLSVIGTLAT
ncbi:Gag-pro-like protein [Cucumis melo var. makuwa]|uniref:Gag-pro-like protein n=1 Tax=Cucumis melo var. makuwa TaxID=1194695 RepID=A0A5D3DWI2_CUCMM|nr:Gag-pro-like protein [Cucumis melo var. makuwa]TYK28043.1 Gag-pro-like protein [Cucumis melo var. makuwa]